jgi:nucleoid-associated protein YgaU
MWLIAKRTLGSGDRWPEIFRLNRDVLQDVNQLSPGTVLRLPPDARVDNSAAP